MRFETATTEPAGEELAARIRGGDRDAIAAVVRAYLPQVLRAEEVAQETFKTFVESAHRFEGRSHVRTWLFGILYRKIAEERRDVARELGEDPIDVIFESHFDGSGRWLRPPRRPDRELESKEAVRQIEHCLDEAPSRQRMAFLLREVEGLATAEICKILGVTVTNLGVMLHRLRNRLRECLEREGVR